MIAFLYPKEDWTAAEIVLKVQALAASQDIEVYSVPKYSSNRKDAIMLKLSRASWAIFLACDKQTIDGDTLEHMRMLKEKGIPIHFIIPASMGDHVSEQGYSENIRTYDPQNRHAIIGTVEHLLKDLHEKPPSAEAGLEVFIALLGLLLLILFLVLLTSKE